MSYLVVRLLRNTVDVHAQPSLFAFPLKQFLAFPVCSARFFIYCGISFSSRRKCVFFQSHFALKRQGNAHSCGPIRPFGFSRPRNEVTRTCQGVASDQKAATWTITTGNALANASMVKRKVEEIALCCQQLQTSVLVFRKLLYNRRVLLLIEAEGKCTAFTNARVHSKDNARVVTNLKFEFRLSGLFNVQILTERQPNAKPQNGPGHHIEILLFNAHL